MTFRPARHLSNAICDALGLPQETQKVVIVLEMGSVATIYVKGVLTEDAVRKVEDAIRLVPVKEVDVADDCTVSFVPLDDPRATVKPRVLFEGK